MARKTEQEKAADRLHKLKTIVKDHQCEKVDGTLVDVTTAKLCLDVYAALNETNKAKFAACRMAKMGLVAWAAVR